MITTDVTRGRHALAGELHEDHAGWAGDHGVPVTVTPATPVVVGFSVAGSVVGIVVSVTLANG
ncbi:MULTISPECIES: hypothetical protein [unclassified Streptomyces]|uniref:hypothetical protein n=1 Tax=unclassified Streptomyces TaxID=2593676 RepID=UPI0019051FC7|nr:hypothetical protein [Streptomyces sp. HSG2]